MTDEPAFARVSPTSRVHIIDTHRPPRIATDLNPEATKAWVNLFGFIGTTYCGHDVCLYRQGGRVGHFPDDDLCIHCYRLWPGPKNHLFQHPQTE